MEGLCDYLWKVCVTVFLPWKEGRKIERKKEAVSVWCWVQGPRTLIVQLLFRNSRGPLITFSLVLGLTSFFPRAGSFQIAISVTHGSSFSSFPFLGTTVCPPCDNELKSEAIIEHLCASEFGKKTSPATPGRFGLVPASFWSVSLGSREPVGASFWSFIFSPFILPQMVAFLRPMEIWRGCRTGLFSLKLNLASALLFEGFLDRFLGTFSRCGGWRT